MPMKCFELVIYSVKKPLIDDYLKYHQSVITQLKQQPGFVSFTTFKNATNNSIMDKVYWETKEDALRAYTLFKQLPCAKDFMRCIENVHYTGHFNDETILNQ